MKKFLSLVLALTLVVSLFTVNVMADSTVHNVTITADKTTELKAGDKITVEVKIDDTLNIEALQYTLVYDTAAFRVDKTKVPPLPTGTPNCFDSTWYSGIKNTGANWGMFLGAPTANCDVDGEIFLGWAGSYGIMDGYNDKDFVIGKFYLIVKDDVVDGTYNIGLSTATEGEYNVPVCNTKSTGEEDVAGMSSTPVTLKVGADAPTPSIEGTTANDQTGVAASNETVGAYTFDNAFAVSVTLKGVAGMTEAGMEFIPKFALDASGWSAAEKATFDSTILGKGDVEYKAALINIPRKYADKTFEIAARPYFVANSATTYGTETTKKFTYTITGEPAQD